MRAPTVAWAASGRVAVWQMQNLEDYEADKDMGCSGCLFSLLGGTLGAADKPQKQQTCCEKAAAGSKRMHAQVLRNCPQRRQVLREMQPNKEDLKLKKTNQREATSAAK